MVGPVGLGTVVMMVSTPRWASQDDQWWAGRDALMAIAVGLISLATVEGNGVRLGVVAATAGVVAAFLARRRWPSLPTVVFVAGAFGPPVALNLAAHAEGTMFLIVVAVSYVALSEPGGRYQLAVGASAIALPAVMALVTSYSWGWPFWMIGIGFGWVFGLQTRRFRLLVAELEAARERLAEQAVFAERRRIASELHDLVGHSLTVVLLFLTGARHRVKEDPASAEDALREAEEIGRQSLAEIRSNVAALRARDGHVALSPTPRVCDVSGLIDQARLAGSDVGLELRGPVDDVETVTGLAVYRVVQESLANATKHAPGSAVRVQVVVDDQTVGVEVVNEGGRQPASVGVGGMGLVGMRERVEALGGRFTAGPQSDSWRVEATMPRGPSRP
jgi:signal transduction histidine kinase